jgi:hypothetical protein
MIKNQINGNEKEGPVLIPDKEVDNSRKFEEHVGEVQEETIVQPVSTQKPLEVLKSLLQIAFHFKIYCVILIAESFC